MLTTDNCTDLRIKAGKGVTVDDGEVSFDWDDVESVTIKDTPWSSAFESDEFYRIRTTVARPVVQQYFDADGKSKYYAKPRSELQKAAWSLDNAPWTLEHPSFGIVTSTDEVRGFFRDPEYVADEDDLDADLYVPTSDSEAQSFLEKYQEVSVGFNHDTSDVDSYSGDIGGEIDVSELDGLQTDLIFDHVASVPEGRCNSEHGCGLKADSVEMFSFKEQFTDTDETQSEKDCECENEDTTNTDNSTMSDDDKDTPSLELADLSVDAVAKKHDGVESILSEKDELESTVDEKESQIAELKETVDELESTVDEYEAAEKEGFAQTIIDNVEAYDEDRLDELMEKDTAVLKDLAEVAEGAKGDASEEVEEEEEEEATPKNLGTNDKKETEAPERITPWS